MARNDRGLASSPSGSQKIYGFFKSGADDFAIIRAFFSAFILYEAGHPQFWQFLRII